MTLAISIIFWILTAGVLFTTLAPLSGSVQWWVRCWDFPRVHIAVIGMIAVGLGFWLANFASIVAGCALLGCILYQASWIYPYTPLATKEVAASVTSAASSRVSLLSVNVLMENEDHARLQTLIDREDPDVLLLMEVNDRWEAALEDQLKRYDTVVRHPLPNHYGMIFATRLPTKSAKMVFLSDDNTPTAFAELEAPGGWFYFVGLHPKPPIPGTDTDVRDEQIRKTATLADRTVLPVVAMGDFNDVAWSRTSRQFKDHGGFRDPRTGRGILASFNAKSRIMRFPIDQLFLTRGLELVSFGRLEDIGSDHFPMKTILAVTARK
ncbi:endonuclease/exonuclease/phosphatase family protein [Roseovarius sp. CAU 1744]|uniref:endonuclease/exonuclease/phosphatase family protein n=1 Tax=Roseovarius sp. CAU 1744 TaxID=3140368 RepID=UPI00325B1BB5